MSAPGAKRQTSSPPGGARLAIDPPAGPPLTAGATLDRREFLKLGTLAGAGLVIGFHLPARLARAATAAAGPFSPNAWLQVGTDGLVTITIDKSEMGQGVMTALPMILAEELEADWSKVRLAPLPDNPAGWHRRMSTGGSTSVRRSWEPLRKAGAAAREMLVRAAAEKWGVEPGACRAEKGAVIDTATARRLGYGELAATAAALPVPESPSLKDAKAFRLLGTRVHRLDTAAKVAGTAVFGIDVQVPGMLVATIERCPVFGGKIKSFDAARAKAAPGVRHVVALEGGVVRESANSPPAVTASGVAVVADTYWQAARARELLQVEWDEGPNAALDSAGIRAHFAKLAEQAGIVARKEGDAAAALAGAARKLEAVYQVPYLHHATMEPMNCTAHVRAEGCEVWAPTQSQTVAQTIAAQVAGMPKDKVRIHTTLLGGGFGRRLEPDFVAEAVELSKRIGAPVKVVWTREDDVQHGFYRPATYNRFAAGLDAAGRPVAWTHRIVAPPILTKFGPLQDGIDATLVEGAKNLPYAIPSILVDQVVADLPVPLGFWRSVGSSQNAYVTECFFDEVARAAGRDPFELRRELLRGRPRHLAALELAAAKSGWGSPLPPGRVRGIAVAESFGSFVAQVAEVSVAGDGSVRVHRVVCAVDCGPVVNPDILEAQMEGGVAYGLTAALRGEITIEKGRVKQSNFHDYPLLAMDEMPAVETHIVPGEGSQGGIGEPSVPPVAPSVANAIFAATGKPVRRLPIEARG